MFSFFTAPETHPEAKTIGQYYQDLALAASNIRHAIKQADDDPSFKRAADVLIALASICQKLETVPALEAGAVNAERSALLKTIGTNGLIDVNSEASKQLALKYSDLLRAVINKEYWPSADCPTFLGQSFLTKYIEGFERRVTHMKHDIVTLEARIASYNRSTQLTIAS